MMEAILSENGQRLENEVKMSVEERSKFEEFVKILD